jgi:hypothetical protein
MRLYEHEMHWLIQRLAPNNPESPLQIAIFQSSTFLTPVDLFSLGEEISSLSMALRSSATYLSGPDPARNAGPDKGRATLISA